MTIHISQTDPEHRDWFKSTFWVHTHVGDNRELFTLTGNVVLPPLAGVGDDWRRERLELVINFPTQYFPEGQWLRVEHWAPFITINNTAMREGNEWRVESFGWTRGTGEYRDLIRPHTEIWADIAVRNIALVTLFTVGYSATFSGLFVDPPPLAGPIDPVE